MTNEIPRRADTQQFTEAEAAIHAAMDAVERAGADPRLTDAVVLLANAKASVADFVDGVPRKEPVRNDYDHLDRVSRDDAFIAGPIKIATYRVRDPETNEWSESQFHMTYDNVILCMMPEAFAKVFYRFMQLRDKRAAEAQAKGE